MNGLSKTETFWTKTKVFVKKQKQKYLTLKKNVGFQSDCYEAVTPEPLQNRGHSLFLLGYCKIH